MRRKSRIVWLAAAAALLSILSVFGFLYPESAGFRAAIRKNRLLEQKTAFLAETVEMDTGDFRARLVFRKGIWYLETETGVLPVRKGKVESLLAELVKPRTIEKIAYGEAAWESLGLEAGNVWRLTVLAADRKPLVDLRFGNTDDRGDSVFLRIGPDKSSYRTDTGAFRLLGHTRKEWLDFLIIDPEVIASKLQSVEVWAGRSFAASSNDDTLAAVLLYSVVRNAQTWSLHLPRNSRMASQPSGLSASPSAASLTASRAAAANRIVFAVLSLEAADLKAHDAGMTADNSSQAILGSIILQLGDGKELTLEISPTTDFSILGINIAGRDWTYFLPASVLAPIFPEDFLK